MSKKIIHQIASCMECGEVFDDYRTGRKDGYNHARRTGHKVTWESAWGGTYHFPKGPPKKIGRPPKKKG